MSEWQPKTARNAEVVKLYRTGLTLRRLAARFGIKMQRVHQILIAAGEPRRPTGRHRKPAPDDYGRGGHSGIGDPA